SNYRRSPRVVSSCVAEVVLTTPFAGQSRYPRPNKGIEAPFSWLQQFNGAYVRPQDKPDGTVRPTANLIGPMDGIIIPLLQPWAALRREATNFELEEDGE